MKKKKGGKEEMKLSLFTDDVLYIENPKHATKKYQSSSTLQDPKLIYRNLLHFYISTVNYQKEKLRKQSPLKLYQKGEKTCTQRAIKHWGKKLKMKQADDW